MISGPKKTVSIVIPEELYKELNEQAQDTSRTLSGYIRMVLKIHLQYLKHFSKLS